MNQSNEVPYGTGGVYFLEGGGLIKIGYSPNGIVGRIAEVRKLSPVPITVLGYVADSHGRRLENALHRRYAAQRHHGEWFIPTPAMRCELKAAAQGRWRPMKTRGAGYEVPIAGL